jgi:hypothetical protein
MGTPRLGTREVWWLSRVVRRFCTEHTPTNTVGYAQRVMSVGGEHGETPCHARPRHGRWETRFDRHARTKGCPCARSVRESAGISARYHDGRTASERPNRNTWRKCSPRWGSRGSDSTRSSGSPVAPRSPAGSPTTLPEQAQQLAALVDCEKTATRIVYASPLIMPGLLQAESYIRAMMETGDIPPDELADRVATRLGRREILKPPNQVQLVAFIGEAALHQVIQSRSVLIDQLRYLFKATTWPNVEIRVIPLSRGWHPALEGPFLLIESRCAGPVVHHGEPPIGAVPA